MRFTDEFPMTVTGKVQKFKMREVSTAELGLEDPRRPVHGLTSAPGIPHAALSAVTPFIKPSFAAGILPP